MTYRNDRKPFCTHHGNLHGAQHQIQTHHGRGYLKFLTDQVEETVKMAINAGCHHISCTCVYENEVGESIKEKIRGYEEDLFVINRLPSALPKRPLVKKACQFTLKDMKLDYLDIYLIYRPQKLQDGEDFPPKIIKAMSHLFSDAWKPMEELVDEKLLKFLGGLHFQLFPDQKDLEQIPVKVQVND